jgi:hypothetical protein
MAPVRGRHSTLEHAMRTALRAILLVATLLLPTWAASAAADTPVPFDTGGKVIDLGVQPAAFPIAMFTEAIHHDRILRAELAKSGWSLRQHAYFKGNDMFADLKGDRLEALALGDIPALGTVAGHDFLIVGLLKHTFSSVVANRYLPLSDLKGKRIGNGKGSTAHYTLLEGLATVSLGEQDVELVDIHVNDMPEALAAGSIDAFSAWEPAPTIALARNPAHFVVYRGVNNSYLLLGRGMVEGQPEVARHFLAAFARALYWMKKDPDNLRRAAQWALKANAAFTGKPPELTVEQAMSITREEALNVPGAPALPKGEATPNGRMAKQLAFLQRLGKIPAGVAWDRVGRSFAPHLIEDILRKPAAYRVFAFDYEP